MPPETIDSSSSESEAGPSAASDGLPSVSEDSEAEGPVPPFLDADELLKELKRRKSPGGEFRDIPTGRPIGEVTYVVMGELFIRCVCRLHTNCHIFMMASRHTLAKTLRCYEWLDSGRRSTTEDHAKESVAVKRQFGIRARSAG